MRVSIPLSKLIPLAALLIASAACRFGTPTAPPPPEMPAAAAAPASAGGETPAPLPTPVQPASASSGDLIVDNTDAAFRVETGAWELCQHGDCQGTCYGEDFLFAPPTCSDCLARFELTAPQSGDYDLWTWWPWGDDRATDTPFTITTSGGPVSIPVDQRNSGDNWFYLTTLTLAAGESVSIQVAASGTGYANADAVALTAANSGEPGQAAASSAAPDATQPQTPQAAPEPSVEPSAPQPEQPALARDGAIIIDHTCTDLTRIPDSWLAQARQLRVHFAHTSHGSQIMSGLVRLAEVDGRCALAVQDWDPPGLPAAADALRLYDGNGWDGDTYITPEMYWATPDGLAHTQAVAASGLFDVSMWSWCGQQSENSTAQVEQYLTTMEQLESQFPGMRFVLMTGHSDGTSDGPLAHNNQLVREYASAHGKVLYDFEDIDSHDPAGAYYPNDAEGACTWCDAWCADHAEDCALPPESCAHSENSDAQRYTCTLKANAFWWMLARMAGWDGMSK